jgi:carbon-monoxide dehydrogenase medium subunit
MKPAPFKYTAAKSVEAALAVKGEHGDEAKFLAGGQSLVPMMNFRLAQPAVVIDINGLPELGRVQVDGKGALRIGALARYRTVQLDAEVSRRQPLIAECLPHIAHLQIRNRGTFGGSLAHADPAAELPAVMVALGARMHVRSLQSERCINADDFFLGIMTTALAPDEVLLEIEIPACSADTGAAFMEVARRHGDFALAGVAATVTIRNGACAGASIALCGVGDRPVNARKAAAMLVGGAVTEEAIDRAADVVQELVEPQGSLHASQHFQRHLAGVLTRRALRLATQRATRHPQEV